MLRGLGTLLALKVVCCGLLVISATGASAGLLAFSSETYLLLAVVGVAAALALVVRRARLSRDSKACSSLAPGPRLP